MKRELVDEASLPPHIVGPDEYPDTHLPKIIDTSTGVVKTFDPEISGVQVIDEPRGVAVYFMQYLALGGATILCFYDTGAQMSCIETSLARQLELRMIDRKGFFLVGAGNHVTRTTDGTYEMLIGKTQGGSIYRFGVCGMEKLTGRMAECDWKPSHALVKQVGAELAQEHDNVKHLDQFLQPDEPLPPSSGGSRARLLIGLRLPVLQPTVIFHLPSGLLVARTKLFDIFNSNVVFGGVYHLVDYHVEQAYAKYASAYPHDRYTAFNRRCHMEYAVFYGSIYPEIFTKSGQDGGKQRDSETGGVVGILNHDDDLPPAATGRRTTDSGWCLEKVCSRQESSNDNGKSKILKGQLMNHCSYGPTKEGPQDCQYARTTDKPQGTADLQGEVSISYSYETPKTAIVKTAGHSMPYGQPKTVPVQGDDTWSMLNNQSGRTAEQCDELINNVDPLCKLTGISEPTSTLVDVEIMLPCGSRSCVRPVICRLSPSQGGTSDAHWCFELGHRNNLMPSKISVVSGGAFNSGKPDWTGILDPVTLECPESWLPEEVCNIANRTCVCDIAARPSLVKLTMMINQAKAPGGYSLGTVVDGYNTSAVVNNAYSGRQMPLSRRAQPLSGGNFHWLWSTDISTGCTPRVGEIREIVEQPPC